MKRLFALIGLTYLSVLAVVFRFFSTAFLCAIIVCAASLIVATVFVKPLRKKKITCIVFAISVLAACLSYTVYSLFVYQPIVDKYYGNSIQIKGYICDEVEKSYNSYLYTVSTDEIDGEKEKIKILVSSYVNLDVEEFDELEMRIAILGDTTNSYKSKKIFLYGDCGGDDFYLAANGNKRKTLYYYAVKIRTTMKAALDNILPYGYSSLCKAVLLGDKKALSTAVKQDFYKTGTSHLFVVSGLHLSVLVGFVLFIIKKITQNRFVICFSAAISVFAFMAITGFSPSVVRSGVMLILTYCASVALRQSDSLNSLGFAAIVITAFNPYAVGDIGLICSFAATAGIIVWSDRLSGYIFERFKIKIRFLILFIQALSVSVSATLWVLPISFSEFGRISPYAPIVSVLAEPFVSVIIVCALLCAVLFICPFVSFLAYPFGLIAGVCCKFVIWMEHIFALLPYASISSDRPFLYIWLIFTIGFAVVGIFIRERKPFYIKCSVAASLLIFVGGWAVNSIIDYNNPKLTVWNSGKGITASVENGSDISILSCGGYVANCDKILEEIGKRYNSIENLVIYSEKSEYSGYRTDIVNEFDVSNIMLYDNEKTDDSGLKCKSLNRYTENETFSIALGSGTFAEIKNIDGISYQLVKRNGVSVLIIPANGDVGKLSEDFRTADYLVTDGLPENFKLLDCEKIIFTGRIKDYEENYIMLSSISKTLINAQQRIDISLNNGGNNAEDN